MIRKASKSGIRQLLVLLLCLPTAFCRSWEAGDACPSTIDVVIPGNTWKESKEPSFDTMTSVHTAMSNCPNITSLDLRVTLLGCSSWPDRWSFPFSLSGGEKYPSLQRLRLEGYEYGQSPFNEVSWSGNSRSYLPWYERAADYILTGNILREWRYRKLPREQREKSNIQLWLDAMDWSKVEELAILGYYGKGTELFLNSTPSVLTGLRRLELESEYQGAALRFLQNVQNDSLTHLVWKDYFNSTLPSIVQQFQGSSLQHLELHTLESDHVESPAFSASELEPLQHMPNLTHLSLNVARNGSWPLEMLSAISQIRSLRSADLWLDIASTCRKQKVENWYFDPEDVGCAGEDQYLLPFINESTTLEVFKHMRANKVGNELSNVTFWGGDWSRAWDGPIYSPPWIEHKQTKVVCVVVDDQGAGGEECVVLTGVDYWRPRPKGRNYYWDDEDV
ncbi:uncharacterized protein A1O9_00986 [Exophiala aquamarina CBS 119918]|uniref:F-box domain-containing protein n=1 Tax=Exophiala aquamarina CBS 119918 TaxID=1182545 RepID=A0A072PT07_9EURO|nr:uncharacterized protein A1O9_00986 [Exophiala aquamarina CBS 119918]KEF63011.1 hypothetical protein A1O9_00986 [Exophiala aquamarina CBS 119918]